ncbi:MAG: hypothetical protein HUK09_09305, partial [Bacteroidaceae bacterium]|nr:hypothetical protein [Bacteroidaceae bacterium]
MPKVFRIHTGANNNVIDWQKGTGITSRAIQDIKDPEGSKASREITSIPSPFARIDLVRQAFQQVANGELEGKSIFHKMVSDTLDVAEIFFNIDKFGDKFEILICRRADIEALMRSQHWGHKALGRTLALYLEQDTKAYNFDRWNDIYLLRYKGPEAEKFEIVGATSPRTLFFTTANDLSHIARHVSFGEDRPFDGDYAPLFKRDPMFVAALWAMSVRDADFCTRFGDLHRYIEACYTHFDAKTRALIEEAETGPAAFLERHCRNIEVGGSQLEVLGMHFPRRSESASAVQHDFAIKRTVGEDKVLVLPTEAGTTYTKLQYVAKAWHSEARAPYFDERPLDQRVLPEEG